MSMPTIALGGSAASIHVGRIAFGCMGLTWTEPSKFTPDAQAFATIRAAVDAGSNFLNAGAFYGPPSDPYANLKLLNRFYKAHPEYKQKTVVSVKGGIDIEMYREKGMAGFKFDASTAALERDLRNIRRELGSDEQDGKQLDIYEMARRDMNTSVEETMYNLLSLSSATYKGKDGSEKKGKGLFGHISLSEVGLETIKAAHAVGPIACVELEISPWETHAFTSGIVAFCADNNIPILAYSPSGRGLLTGTIQSASDIPEGDPRKGMDRLNEDNIDQNLKLAHVFIEQAKKQQPQECTPTQLGLAWLIASGSTIIPLPGTTKEHRAKENAGAALVKLSPETKEYLDEQVQKFEVAGGRYSEAGRKHTPLWG